MTKSQARAKRVSLSLTQVRRRLAYHRRVNKSRPMGNHLPCALLLFLGLVACASDPVVLDPAAVLSAQARTLLLVTHPDDQPFLVNRGGSLGLGQLAVECRRVTPSSSKTASSIRRRNWPSALREIWARPTVSR